ncbi:MAG: zinc ABC transporter substrate-binding protein [bacterium]|nr:zinc ABC transporter substrate-binding protein [bacterium]
MKKSLFIIVLMLAALTQVASASVKLVASSSDLASIAKEIGGDKIEISSIGTGKANLHFVEMLPSYMLKVSKADIYLKIGLTMDQWADGIIDGSRNGKIVIVDCSKGIDVLEKPTGKVDASMGDVHPSGNPHYWLDPRNGKTIAKNILDGLVKADPANASAYEANFASFTQRLDSAWQNWSTEAASFRGLKLVSYHTTYSYFANAFGIEIAGQIEPKPGIEPTASHTSELINLMSGQHISVIFREPYFSERAPNSLAKATGATVYTVPSSVGGVAEATDYFSLFDTLLGTLKKANGH